MRRLSRLCSRRGWHERATGVLIALAVGIAALGSSAILFSESASSQDGEEVVEETTDKPTITDSELTAAGIELTWSPPTDSRTVVGYSISRSTGGVNGTYDTIVNDTGSTDTTYTDSLSGVAIDKRDSGSGLYYKVRAKFEESDDTTSFGAWSDHKRETLEVFPKPSNLELEVTKSKGEHGTASSITVSWSAPTLSWSYGDISIDGYTVWRVTLNGPGESDDVRVEMKDVNSSTFSYTEIAPSLTNTIRGYRYEVRATYGVYYSWEVSTNYND